MPRYRHTGDMDLAPLLTSEPVSVVEGVATVPIVATACASRLN